MKDRKPKRDPLLSGPYDLAVVGGGINGAALARDAGLRGKSVVLLEKDDLGEGTSSRSSKMIHGGIRYLEGLHFGLVYESLRERHYLLHLASHLVQPQTFVLPVYTGAPHGVRMTQLGLFLYDKLAWGRRPGKCQSLSVKEILERVPTLEPSGLQGGGLYYDGVMNDARLVLANVLAALEESRSVVVRNHMEVREVRGGSPCSLRLADGVTGAETSILAHRVVRALGPWSEPDRLVPSKGAHVVIPALPTPDGLLLTHSKDGRVFFVIPWQGHTVVGTTETLHEGPPDNLRVEASEVSYLLDELRRVLPGLGVTNRDILGTFAGIRPLARQDGFLARRSPGAVSRNHKVVDEGNGVVSVFGGKYTTYRAVAKDVLDRVFPGTACITHQKVLPGAEAGPWEEYRRRLPAGLNGHDPREVERLFRRYGCRLGEVLRLIDEDPTLAEPLAPDVPETRAEVVHAARTELAVYPEDFLVRRTTLRYSAGGGRSAYDAIEQLLSEHGVGPPPDLAAARARYFAELEHEDELRGIR
jgi:glycerol-3-phosphate dehydrogenase